MTLRSSEASSRSNGAQPAPMRLVPRPSREDALQSVRTLLRYIGEDPDREGLVETPERVLKAWDDLYGGYGEDPGAALDRTFEEVSGYDEIVVLRGIEFFSHCEHHMIPIEGRADVAYLPDRRVVGLSKLARVVDGFARRLQTQEALTAQIADSIEVGLQPRGVAVFLHANHRCMAMRGVRQVRAETVTSTLRGAFQTDVALAARLERLLAR